MPLAIRKLDQNEASQAFKSATKVIDLSEYVEALQGLGVGDAAEVTVNGEGDRATTRRFNAAAKQLGVKLQWEVGQDEAGNTTRFLKVVEPGDGRKKGRVRQAASVQSEPEQTADQDSSDSESN